MFSVTVDVYNKLLELYTKVFEEKKALMKENEELKETLRCIRQDNQELRAKLFSKPNDDKLDDLEKRVEHLEYLLTPEEPAEEKLKVGKWYHTTGFTKEELERLLPVGTKIETEYHVLYDGIATTKPTETKEAEVKGITKGNWDGSTYISTDSLFKREWFKIIEE